MTQKLSPESVLSTSSDVRFRRVLDEAVVIRQKAAETLVLNEVAVSLLELCDGGRTLSDISSALQNDYDADADTIDRDVMNFAQELLNAGLVELEVN